AVQTASSAQRRRAMSYRESVGELAEGERSSAALPPGTRWGKYEIVRRIGGGAQATVYEGRTLVSAVPPIYVPRALTVYPVRATTPGRERDHLGREATALVTILHPNVVRYYGAILEGNRYGLVLELVQGPSLRERLNQAHGHLAREEFCWIMYQVCEGLAA